MKVTLSTYEVADQIYQDKSAGWTREGALALAEYLESVEEDTGSEMELDVVAIRCEYAEYPSALDAAKEYGTDYDEESALSWLKERTTVIEFDCGIIIQQL